MPIQALLLLADDPLKTLLYQAEKPCLLRAEKIGPNTCDRVAVTRPDGPMVFWIDQKSKILRRFEYPAGKSLNDYWFRGTAKGLAVVADYRDAADSGHGSTPMPSSSSPRPARTWSRRSFLPTWSLLGKPAPSFKFTAAGGKPVTAESLKGKVAVLAFWATKCEHCPRICTCWTRSSKNTRANDKVVFEAVNIDPPETDDQAVRQALDELKIGIPLVRDAEQASGRVFMISAIPTMVILDAQGERRVLRDGRR